MWNPFPENLAVLTAPWRRAKRSKLANELSLKEICEVEEAEHEC